jgi:hypothetical protein
MSVSSASVPVTFVKIAVCVDQAAQAMPQIIFVVTLVPSSVSPNHNPSPFLAL